MAIVKLAEGDLLNNDVPVAEALADVEVTNRFVKLAESTKRIAPRSDDFLYFTAIFMHAAEAAMIDLKTGAVKKDKHGNDITGGFNEQWKWLCSDAALDPYSNQNGDIFPEIELKKAFKKWVGRPLCINHQSSDIEGVRGIIIDTHYDDKYKRVVGLCAIDKKTYPDLAHKVKSGQASNVSMGTAVGRALCTVCQKVAVIEKDYCDCVRSKKGQRINGVKVGEINLDLNPIELSLVVTPADQQAKVLKIVAAMNNYVDQRNSLVENKQMVETAKLAKLDNSIANVETQLNRLFAECSDNSCQFVRGTDGHITLVKSAQDTQEYTWKDFLSTAKELDKANDYDKRDLIDSLNHMKTLLDIKDLYNDPALMTEFSLNSLDTTNKYLHEKILQPIVNELMALKENPQSQPMQENQFTTPDGPDKDLGFDAGSEVTMPSNEQQTGGRLSKVVNPSETGTKPDKGGELGPEMGSASDRFQFGNYASSSMAEGGKIKNADIEENLNLLLKQTQDIEKEMNTIKNNVTTTTMNSPVKPATMEELKMNEARLKLRAAQRMALLKNAEKEMCEECEKEVKECTCEEKKEKKAYWQGTEEPKPGQVQYKPENGGEPKTRMNDKQMHQDKSMGGAEGAFPGDEAEKKKLLRAELIPGILRTKFTKVRNADGSYNKQASYFEVFAGENKLLKATAEEIYGDELEKTLDGTEKTAWDVLSSPEYGKEVMAAIRADGFQKVAYLLKGAQAAMPELPPAMDAAPMGGEPKAPELKQVDVNEVMMLLGEAEDKLSAIKQALVGEDDGEVKNMSVETEDAGAPHDAGAELTASVIDLGREIYAELDKSADELALLVDYLEKSASLSTSKKSELNKLATDAIADNKALLEEADTILAVAGKIPPGLKAFQDKKKGKDKDKKDDKKEDKKDEKKGKDKKEDKDEKKGKDKKDDKKDKKKSKKAALAEMLLKLANELGEDGGMDELDKDMMELGLLPEEHKADDELVEHGAPANPMAPAAHKNNCGMCGMAMDQEHACTASTKDELVREALAARRMKREAILKAAEDKKYDVVPDTHGLEGEAHKGSEANPTTQLDIKPAGDGAVIEGIDKKHDEMMDAAEAAPTGKQGASATEIKEAAIKAELETELKTKKAEEDKTKFRVKLRRAYDLGLMMQEKGMITRTKEALDKQVDEVVKLSDEAFESYKRAVANVQAQVKTASVTLPQVGVREDNSKTGDNAVEAETLASTLKKLW